MITANYNTKEYYEQRIEELERDQDINICALKFKCLNSYTSEIIELCKRIADYEGMIHHCETMIEELKENE